MHVSVCTIRCDPKFSAFFIYDIGSVSDTRFDCLLVQISPSLPKVIQTENLCVCRSLRYGIRFDRLLILSEHMCMACVCSRDSSFMTFIIVEYGFKLRLCMVFASFVNVVLSDTHFCRRILLRAVF